MGQWVLPWKRKHQTTSPTSLWLHFFVPLCIEIPQKSSIFILFYFLLSLRLLLPHSTDTTHAKDMHIAETNSWFSVFILLDFSAVFDRIDHLIEMIYSPLGFQDITYSYPTGCPFSSPLACYFSFPMFFMLGLSPTLFSLSILTLLVVSPSPINLCIIWIHVTPKYISSAKTSIINSRLEPHKHLHSDVS